MNVIDEHKRYEMQLATYQKYQTDVDKRNRVVEESRRELTDINEKLVKADHQIGKLKAQQKFWKSRQRKRVDPLSNTPINASKVDEYLERKYSQDKHQPQEIDPSNDVIASEKSARRGILKQDKKERAKQKE